MSQFSMPYPGLRVLTDAPGAVIEVVELAGGVRLELNGTGTVVGFVYPDGLDGQCLCETDDDDGWESPQDRVERLKAELKEAKEALPRKAKADVR